MRRQALWLCLATLPATPAGAGTATLAGIVRYHGEVTAHDIPVRRDQDVCGRTRPDQAIVVGPDATLANVAVWLDGTAAASASVPADRPVVEIRGCAFEPRVFTLEAGQALRLRNGDPIPHTVIGTAIADGAEALRVYLPLQNQARPALLRDAGVVQLRTVEHPWMSGWVIALDDGASAVTDRLGRFRIVGLEPGVYTLHTWHERLGEQRSEVRLLAGDETVVELVYAP